MGMKRLNILPPLKTNFWPKIRIYRLFSNKSDATIKIEAEKNVILEQIKNENIKKN